MKKSSKSNLNSSPFSGVSRCLDDLCERKTRPANVLALEKICISDTVMALMQQLFIAIDFLWKMDRIV